MSRTYPRICCLLVLALACNACGGGTTTPGVPAAVTATLTKFVLPPEDTPTSSEPSDANPEATPESSEPDGTNPEEPVPSGPAPTVDGGDLPASTPVLEATPTAGSEGGFSGPLCNDALFIEDVTIPDGTVLAPEENFRKTWRFRNTGFCSWTTDYAIGFGYGTRMKGADAKLPHDVDPGQSVDVSVDMAAPKESGWYGGWWRLKNDAGTYFGDFVYVSVMVEDGG